MLEKEKGKESECLALGDTNKGPFWGFSRIRACAVQHTVLAIRLPLRALKLEPQSIVTDSKQIAEEDALQFKNIALSPRFSSFYYSE